MASINEKKTKAFKFLDLDWHLCAQRDDKTKELNISLNLISSHSENTKEGDSFNKIGVFYTKLIRNVEGNSK